MVSKSRVGKTGTISVDTFHLISTVLHSALSMDYRYAAINRLIILMALPLAGLPAFGWWDAARSIALPNLGVTYLAAKIRCVAHQTAA
jgi:hypothetical protein